MDQIMEWEAFDIIDPIGSWRADLNTARLMAQIENLTLATHTGKNDPEPKWASPSKYMPRYGEEDEKKPEETITVDHDALARQIKRMVRQHNKAYDKKQEMEAKLNKAPQLPHK